jgi:putative Mg2+ transporter-C (MgtC) family protein
MIDLADQWTGLGLVLVAAALGGVIGFERAEADKPAGLRTHMLVCAAAALIIVLGRFALEDAAAESDAQGDPSRALHAVVTGIGFIGAGTIIVDRSGQRVRGLTTATGLFFTAALGMAVGFEFFVLAGGATVLALVALRVIHWLEARVHHDSG